MPTVQRMLALGLFKGMERPEVERLAAGATQVPAPRGTFVFRQGEPCTGMYVVMGGQVKLSLDTERGQEKILQLIGEGESFGEAALFLAQRHITTAQAIADGMLLHIAREAVLKEVARNPGFAQRLVEELSRQLRQRVLDLKSYTLLSGKQRVVAYLLERVPERVNGSAVSILLPARKGIIASRLNITQEHFSRILHDLAAESLIEVRGLTVCIPDVERLHAYRDMA